MALTDDWKSAKSLFETATKKKKPSEKFLGVFRKGTGVEGALKKADAAKTAADLRKALTEFKKEAELYTKTLKAAAADPKSVPAEDKASYIANTVALEKALDKLVTTGESMAASLDGADKKTKVDPALMKQEAELAAHLALRKKMFGVCTTVLADFKKQAGEIDTCLNKAVQFTAEAKKKHLANNQAEALVAIGVVNQFQQKAVGIMKSVEDDWTDRTKNGSEMMKARGDQKTLPTAWTTEKKAAYAKESNAAFGAYDAVQVQIQGVLSGMRLKIASVNRAAEEAATYTNQALDPKTFAARLTEINKEITDLDIWVTRKLSTLKNNLEKQKGVLGDQKTPKGDIVRGFTLVRDAEVKAQEGVNTRVQSLVEMAKRVSLIPQGLRADPAIAPGFKQFTQTAGKVKTDLASVKTEQQNFINFLNKSIQSLG
jgi:hypothetical protein